MEDLLIGFFAGAAVACFINAWWWSRLNRSTDKLVIGTLDLIQKALDDRPK